MHSSKFHTLGKISFVPNTAPGFCFLWWDSATFGTTEAAFTGSNLFLTNIKITAHIFLFISIHTSTRWKVKRAYTISEGLFCTKGGSESMAVSGLLQSSTAMLKFIFKSVRPVQLPGEAWDSNTASITSQAGKAHRFSTLNTRWKNTGQNTNATRRQDDPTSYQLQSETATKARATRSPPFPQMPPLGLAQRHKDKYSLCYAQGQVVSPAFQSTTRFHPSFSLQLNRGSVPPQMGNSNLSAGASLPLAFPRWSNWAAPSSERQL